MNLRNKLVNYNLCFSITCLLCGHVVQNYFVAVNGKIHVTDKVCNTEYVRMKLVTYISQLSSSRSLLRIWLEQRDIVRLSLVRICA